MVPKFDCCFYLPLNSRNAFLKCAIVARQHVSLLADNDVIAGTLNVTQQTLLMAAT